MEFYSYEEIKQRADCIEVARDLLGLEVVKRGSSYRCNAVWRGGDSFSVSLSKEAWYDHGPYRCIEERDGSQLDLVACAKEITVPEAAILLGRFIGLKPSGKPVRQEYVYVDRDGRPLHREVRDFRYPNPYQQAFKDGEWVNDMSGTETVPFNLPAVIESSWVLLCEGPKDGQTAIDLGFVGTSFVNGAGAWEDRWRDWFKGKHIVISQDNDEAGTYHAQNCAYKLWSVAAGIKIINLMPHTHKGDITDWKEAGGTPEQLLEVIMATPALTQRPDRPKKPTQLDKRCKTSKDNGEKGGRPPITKELADAFAASYTKDGSFLIRKYHGSWYLYHERVYKLISDDDLQSLVMEFLRGYSPTNATINMRNNIIANIQGRDLGGVPSYIPMPSWQDGTDASGWLIMQNGIVHVENAARVKSGEELPSDQVARDHTPNLFSTFAVDYPFDPTSTCPKWESYIAGVQPTDETAREALQMLCGLALIPDTTYEVFFLFLGEGGCGKTVYLFVLEQLVGSDNVCCLPIAKFAEKHSTHLLAENLLNIVGELPTQGNNISLHHIEGILKNAASGENVPVERKGKDPVKAPAIARSIFASNTLPAFADRTDGIWDRVRIIPFNQKFRNTDTDVKGLKYIIAKEELPGVFNWALDGLAKLRKRRMFPHCNLGLEILKGHRRSCDHEREFLEEYYEIRNGAYVVRSELYQHYREFCQKNGYHPKNSANFYRELERVFPEAYESRERLNQGRLHLYRNMAPKYDAQEACGF